jgi:hypothetical protein
MADTIIDGFFDALGSGAFTMPVDLTPWRSTIGCHAQFE